MLQIGNTLISLDIIENYFCCDLDKCHGQCCVEGDAGAPVTPEEVAMIENEWLKCSHFMSPLAIEEIKKKGVSYIDEEGDLVTTIINGKDCVFTHHENGCCFCALEKNHRVGKSEFIKPVSCALYPIRITEYPTFTALNLHKWDICKPAFIKGKQENIRVYEFLKDILIKIFGKQWFEELDFAAKLYLEEKEL